MSTEGAGKVGCPRAVNLSVGVDSPCIVTAIKQGAVWVEIPPDCLVCGRGLESGLMLVGWNGRQRTYSCLRCNTSWAVST